MRVIDLENINSAMRNEEQFVLRCEEVFHDKIGSAAATILADVYKRQWQYPSKFGSAICSLNSLHIHLFSGVRCNRHGQYPVSYTHLDVYKRQLLR